MPVNTRIESLSYNPSEETLRDDFFIVKKMTEKYKPLVEAILKLYSCERCGRCCREEKVTSGRSDFEQLSKFNKYLFMNALERTKGNLFTLKAPCHYLTRNDKSTIMCKCYKVRPLPCRYYPFVFLYGYFISISYCQYGTKIINDITKFIETVHPEIKIQSKEESCNKHMIDVIDRIDEFHKELGLTKKGTKIMNVPFEVLELFYVWKIKTRRL